jgi:hypothetical protein
MNTSTHPMIKSTDIPQLSSMENGVNSEDISQNHQYECIPEYLLTMSRHHPPPRVCHHSHQLCDAPYSNFSRLYLTPQEITTTNASDSSQCTCSPPPPSASIVQEESSTPLLAASISKESHRREQTSSPKSMMMMAWTRRNSSSTTKRKSTEQRRSFLSQFRKSSIS